MLTSCHAVAVVSHAGAWCDAEGGDRLFTVTAPLDYERNDSGLGRSRDF